MMFFEWTQGKHLSENPGVVRSVACDRNGTRVVTSQADQCSVWDLETGALQYGFAKNCNTSVSASMSSDGTVAVVAGEECAVAGYVDTSHESVIPLSGKRIQSLALHPQANLIACGTSSGKILLHHLPEGRSDGHFGGLFGGHKAPVLSLVFNEDGDFLLSGDTAGQVCLWCVARRKKLFNVFSDEMHRFAFGRGEIPHVALNHDGSRALAVCRDLQDDRRGFTVTVWDVGRNRLEQSFRTWRPGPAFFTPDGMVAETGIAPAIDERGIYGVELSLNTWSIRTGQPVERITTSHDLDGAEFADAVVSRDGRSVAVSFRDRAPVIYRVDHIGTP